MIELKSAAVTSAIGFAEQITARPLTHQRNAARAGRAASGFPARSPEMPHRTIRPRSSCTLRPRWRLRPEPRAERQLIDTFGKAAARV
jgi:hypothetical protein